MFPFGILGASFLRFHRHPLLPRATVYHRSPHRLSLHSLLPRFRVAHPRHPSSRFPHHHDVSCLLRRSIFVIMHVLGVFIDVSFVLCAPSAFADALNTPRLTFDTHVFVILILSSRWGSHRPPFCSLERVFVPSCSSSSVAPRAWLSSSSFFGLHNILHPLVIIRLSCYPVPHLCLCCL